MAKVNETITPEEFIDLIDQVNKTLNGLEIMANDEAYKKIYVKSDVPF